MSCLEFVNFSIIDLCSNSEFHGLELMTFQITTNLLNYTILYTYILHTHKFQKANRISNKVQQHICIWQCPKIFWFVMSTGWAGCGLYYPNLTRAMLGHGLAGPTLSDGRIIHVKINQDIIHKLTLHFYQRHVIMCSILRLINIK